MSFYLSGWKLILAVYHIVVDPKTNVSKFNRYQAECVIPWANDVLLLLTVALQAAQQMKDKVIFQPVKIMIQTKCCQGTKNNFIQKDVETHICNDFEGAI